MGLLTISYSLLLVILTTKMTKSQKNCSFHPNVNTPNYFDVVCHCMEVFYPMNIKVNELTVNQTRCTEISVINWYLVETIVSPRTLVVVGNSISFDSNLPDNTSSWESSIVYLYFLNSSLPKLPSNALRGLNRLTELHVYDSKIEIIESEAISSLPALKAIGFTNSEIGVLNKNSMRDLPVVLDIAFIRCKIKIFESFSINNMLPPKLPNSSLCPTLDARSKNESGIENMLSRELLTRENFTLPNYGSRLFFYSSVIGSLQSKAITTNNFGFVIFAGNTINTLYSAAFDTELQNECEISAAIFIGNDIGITKSKAFSRIKGSDAAKFRTFLALTNNTFNELERESFSTHKSLQIYTISENLLQCTCNYANWFNGANNEIVEEVQKEIIKHSLCLNNRRLFTEYISKCPKLTGITKPLSSEPHNTSINSKPNNSCHIQTQISLFTVIFVVFSNRLLDF